MINVRIIADSLSKQCNRVTTFELEYPRYIHAEVMTHRVFSRNAASSRAIPIEKMIEQVTENTVMPIWTQNQSGMQGSIISNGVKIHELNQAWLTAAEDAVYAAKKLAEAGAHKQNANRILEPFQHIKVVLTATEFDNFFALRFHEDAQPEIQELAMQMFAAYHKSEPNRLLDGEWHTPYADTGSLDTRRKISASCCAQVSYRKNDDSEEKAELVFQRLVGGKPLHASPFEHQCTPMREDGFQRGNLIGWKQLRHDIEDGLYLPIEE